MSLTTAATNFAPARLDVIVPSLPGQFQLRVTGQSNQQYVVEASPNLQVGSWVPLVTNSSSSGQFIFSDTQSSNFVSRFYRGRQLQ